MEGLPLLCVVFSRQTGLDDLNRRDIRTTTDQHRRGARGRDPADSEARRVLRAGQAQVGAQEAALRGIVGRLWGISRGICVDSKHAIQGLAFFWRRASKRALSATTRWSASCCSLSSLRPLISCPISDSRERTPPCAASTPRSLRAVFAAPPSRRTDHQGRHRPQARARRPPRAPGPLHRISWLAR
jgi:hypothetical protein